MILDLLLIGRQQLRYCPGTVKAFEKFINEQQAMSVSSEVASSRRTSSLDSTQRMHRSRKRILTLPPPPSNFYDDEPSLSTTHVHNPLLSTSTIENGLKAQGEFDRLRRMENFFMGLSGLDVLLLLVYYELDHHQQGETQKAQALLIGAYLSHCFACMARGAADRMQHEMNHYGQSKKDPLQKIIYFTLCLLFWLSLIVLHPFPALNQERVVIWDPEDSQSTTIKTNYLLMLTGLAIKAILTMPSLLYNTGYLQPRCGRVKQIYSVKEHSKLFAFKCLFKDMPIPVFSLLFIVGFLYFAVAIRVVESSVEGSPNRFSHFQNCAWFIFINVSTVGFGDISPATPLGQIIAVLCIVWGTVMTSSLLVILTNTLQMDPKEEEALQLYKRIEGTLNLKTLSGQYIRVALWRLWLNKKNKKYEPEGREERGMRVRLWAMRNQARRQGSGVNIQEEMQKQFDNALINIDFLMENNNRFLSFITHKFFLDGTPNYVTSLQEMTGEGDSEWEDESEHSLMVKKQDRNSLRVEAEQISLNSPLSTMTFEEMQMLPTISRVQ